MRVWKTGVLSLFAAGWVSCGGGDKPTCCAIPPPECLIGDDSMCEEHYVCVARKGYEEISQPGHQGTCKMTCSAEKECAPGFACVVDYMTGEDTCKMTCNTEKACKPEFACMVKADTEEGICEVGCFSNNDCSAVRPDCVLRGYSEIGLGECQYLKCTKDNEECPTGYFCVGASGFCHPETL